MGQKELRNRRYANGEDPLRVIEVGIQGYKFISVTKNFEVKFHTLNGKAYYTVPPGTCSYLFEPCKNFNLVQVPIQEIAKPGDLIWVRTDNDHDCPWKSSFYIGVMKNESIVVENEKGVISFYFEYSIENPNKS